MKRITAGLVALGIAMPAPAIPPVLPTFPPLHEALTHPDKIVLSNGLVVFLMVDHELPVIQMQAIFNAGSQYDPPGKVGLSSLWAEAWTEGGTTTRSPEEIEKLLDRKAASLSFSMDLEKGGANLSCRRDDFSEIYSVFVDLLENPDFRKDALDLAKEKALESMLRMNDDPEDVSRREFRRLMYGGAHPYARIPTPETIRAIKREDVKSAHRRLIQPNGSYLAVSGDFDPATMKTRLEDTLGRWAKGDASRPAIAPVPPGMNSTRVFYTQRALRQSQIRIGQLGITRHSPDYFAWLVFNELWGAGSTSRLFKTVRTQQGLAYAVGSAFSAPNDRGLIVAISQTRGAKTIAAARSILAINEEIRRAPFTPDDIQGAKDTLINEFIQNFTTPAQIAGAFMSHAYFGFPPDFLDTYTQKIADVSAADLKRVGQTYLKPETSTIYVLGDLSTFEKPIGTLGKAREIVPLDFTRELQ